MKSRTISLPAQSGQPHLSPGQSRRNRGARLAGIALPAVAALLLAAAAPLATATVAPLGFQAADLALLSGPGNETGQSNENLSPGVYVFAAAHTIRGEAYLDEWTFSLAGDADVAIHLEDLKLDSSGIEMRSHSERWDDRPLLGNRYLTFSLFDESGRWIAGAGAGATLLAANLIGGEHYTLTASGRAEGLVGGIYYGALSAVPAALAPVPLNDSLLLYGSGLLLSALRLVRRRM